MNAILYLLSKELQGKKTIIYFYPKDNTSGCTAEACNPPAGQSTGSRIS